jgi:O-antigen ligase
MAAAASCCPLGAGLYLCLSRGALFAAGVGLLMLVLLAPQREQLRATVVCSTIVVMSGLAAIPISQMRWLEGSLASRERTGLLVLLLLVAISAGAALSASTLVVRGRTSDLGLSPRTRVIPSVLVTVAFVAFIAVGTARWSPAPVDSGANRLITTNSLRYAYWRVALHAFTAEPIRGVGAGGWATSWLREQPLQPPAQDAHSLPLQTLAELGLVGVGLLTAFLCGVALAGRYALQVAPRAAVGPIAGCVVYLAHAPLDWDWEMPAVTLVAIILAGALLGGGPVSET